jgi:hypothetical protein
MPKFFAEFFVENIQKIITSVPGVSHPTDLPEPARDARDQARHGVLQGQAEVLPHVGHHDHLLQVTWVNKSKVGHIWEGLGRSRNFWFILRPFWNIYGHLVYFVVIWYIFFPILVCCTKKNLATLNIHRPKEMDGVLSESVLHCRVARWYIFKPKIPYRVNFEGALE